MNIKKINRITLGVFTVVFLLVHLPANLAAQSTFGSIVGIVQDASGAPMSEVAVKSRI